jgi:hypothetical protein
MTVSVIHGTRSGYTNGACRCEECSDAQRRYQREYVAANGEGIAAGKRQYRQDHPEKRTSGAKHSPEYVRAYYQANQDKIKARASRWARDNPERKNASARSNPNTPVNQRRKHLKWKYGITLEEFDVMLRSQGDRCAICRTEDPGRNNWHVDHDHETGSTRGILCMRCNNGIGFLGDDPSRLDAAAAYLRLPR